MRLTPVPPDGLPAFRTERVDTHDATVLAVEDLLHDGGEPAAARRTSPPRRARAGPPRAGSARASRTPVGGMYRSLSTGRPAGEPHPHHATGARPAARGRRTRAARGSTRPRPGRGSRRRTARARPRLPRRTGGRTPRVRARRTRSPRAPATAAAAGAASVPASTPSAPAATARRRRDPTSGSPSASARRTFRPGRQLVVTVGESLGPRTYRSHGGAAGTSSAVRDSPLSMVRTLLWLLSNVKQKLRAGRQISRNLGTKP